MNNKDKASRSSKPKPSPYGDYDNNKARAKKSNKVEDSKAETKSDKKRDSGESKSKDKHVIKDSERKSSRHRADDKDETKSKQIDKSKHHESVSNEKHHRDDRDDRHEKDRRKRKEENNKAEDYVVDRKEHRRHKEEKESKDKTREDIEKKERRQYKEENLDGKEVRRHRDDERRKHKVEDVDAKELSKNRDDRKRDKDDQQDIKVKRKHQIDDVENNDKIRHKDEEKNERDKRKHRDKKEKKNYHDEDDDDETVYRLVEHKNRKTTKETLEIEEEYGMNDYNDDFEDYDEDFEEVDNNSIDQTNQESIDTTEDEGGNRKLSKNSQMSTLYNEEDDEISTKPVKSQQIRPIGVHSSFINFQFAQRKFCHDVLANKMLGRAYDLSKLIDFEHMSYNVADIPPVTEHSLYYARILGGGVSHIASQTHDDNMARAIQTEFIGQRHCWTQYPPCDSNYNNNTNDFCSDCCGVDGHIIEKDEDNAGDPLRRHNTYKSALHKIPEENSEVQTSVDYKVINRNLNGIADLLEEEATYLSIELNRDCNQLAISKAHSLYDLPSSDDQSQSYQVLLARMVHSASHSNLFAAVYRSKSSETNMIEDQFICIWSVARPGKQPLYKLSCPQSVNVTSMNFPSTEMLLCGLNTGVILLYDLIGASVHDSIIQPAYLSIYQHFQPIISLEFLSNQHLISIDSQGVCCNWSVTHSGSKSDGGSMIDLQLSPGSTCNLYKLSSHQLLSNRSIDKGPSETVTCACLGGASAKGLAGGRADGLAEDATNSHHSLVLLGTNTGRIYQYARVDLSSVQMTSHHKSPPHKVYGCMELFQYGSVTSIDYYPYNEDFILASYDDSTLRIFHPFKGSGALVQMINPSTSISPGQSPPILQSMWSKCHPAHVFSLDAVGHLVVWSLCENTTPVQSATNKHQAHLTVATTRPVISVNLPVGFIGFDMTQCNTDKLMLLWNLEGKLQIHQLDDALIQPQSEDFIKTIQSLYYQL